MTIHLAGVPIRDELVLDLARLVEDDELGARLETAYGRVTKVPALTIPGRQTIIAALDDAPPGLDELRGVLLREHVGRVRDGLVWRRGTRWLESGVWRLAREAGRPVASRPFST